MSPRSFGSRFRGLTARMLKSYLPYYAVSDDEYLYYMWMSHLFSMSMKVPGHIVEVGVAGGRNSIIFGRLLELTGESYTRKYYGFDTFEGYCKDTVEENPWLNVNSWKGEEYSLHRVRRRIERLGYETNCVFIKGDCRKTLPEFLQNHSDDRIQPGHACIALLYVDCNAYNPALTSMQSVYPHMPSGGIIAIDEKRQGGETQAILEFAKTNGLECKHDYFRPPIFLVKP